MQIDDKEILKNTSVLFVDDNLVVRKEIGRFLQNRVGTHFLAENGRMGLESFNKYKARINKRATIVLVKNKRSMSVFL